MLSGHSERRAVFGDSDEEVNAKTLKILAQGLKCILCIGELKEVRSHCTRTERTYAHAHAARTCTRTHARTHEHKHAYMGHGTWARIRACPARLACARGVGAARCPVAVRAAR